MTRTSSRAVGTDLPRLEGTAKVVGGAPFAYEHPVEQTTYAHLVLAGIARGRITAIDAEEAESQPGVLFVLTHLNAGRLADTSDRELAPLQSAEIAFHGQIVGVVVAEDPETAREAAGLVHLTYERGPHSVTLDETSTDLYAPEAVNPEFASDTDNGDVEAALAAAAITVDATYRTPMEHNNPMEPHTTVATWDETGGRDRLTLFDSTQGVHGVRTTVAPVLGLDPHQVRVVAPYVGGGFGSKGLPHAHQIAVSLAARETMGRPVKLALTRQQMFTLAGHRTPTIQHIRLGCDHEGRLSAIVHEVVEHTSRIKEFAEQTAVATRMMYSADNRRTSHRLAALDVPVPSWMRAPGEAPGSFALEVALDELAREVGLDPIELRARNDPASDPESGLPWSSRNLVACLRQGAEAFGWDPASEPGQRRVGSWYLGHGVASATYPMYAMPGTQVEIEYTKDHRYAVRVGAVDIGTGTWTALSQIAADALECPVESIALEIGDTELPEATIEGGSSGITSWGSAIVSTAKAFQDEHTPAPLVGAITRAAASPNPDADKYSIHSFGAQFAEVRVNVDTGEIRVPRMLGVFSVGQIINPRTARSQFIGGMVMGQSAALYEEAVLDPHTGSVVNHDFAQYHIAAHADIGEIEATWLDERDDHANPMGSKGIGEIGIVGAAAAIANATYDATGIRVRSLPLTADRFLA